jgi:hypothetical protein
MTKPAKEVVAPQENVAVTTALSSVFDEEGSDRWMRDSALAYAISLHKNNGGMTTAPQIIGNADIFLNFLKGENK